MLKANFGSLLRFADNLGSEVSGRQTVAPPDEIQKLLRNLSHGKLSAKERKSVFETLLKEPGWLTWFAREIKAQRPGEDGYSLE